MLGWDGMGVKMVGKKARGRPRRVEKTYEFHFYYRLNPAEDPPELAALLEALVQANGRKRRDILRSALLGGAQQVHNIAAGAEDSQTAQTLGEMFSDF